MLTHPIERTMTDRKTILVADDDPHIRNALTRRLEANRYRVLTAADGLLAMKLVLQKKPDLLILDICMPVGIGLSVAERIRERQLDIPIIFLTALKTPGIWGAARRTGAVGFLVKPYEPTELLELVQFALNDQPELVAG